MRPREGFSLLEVVVAISILLLLAGAVVPLAAGAITSARNDSTRERITDMRRSIATFAKDVLRLPTTLVELRRGGGIAGWNGPYTSAAFDTAGAGTPDGGFAVDAFGRALSWTLGSDVRGSLTSAGEDGTFGTADDISTTVDLMPALRAETVERLEIANQAITLYNRDHLPASPLPSSWSAGFNTCVAGGYLPNDSRYLHDPWGDTFVPDPPGSSPLTRVASIHLQ
jgi:prepilin-type N-terminal cleavage/methylation domain-containing protein